MARILARLPCPKHVDKTPSLTVYAQGWAHCYSCGWRTPADTLGFSQEEKEIDEDKYVEDVEASIRRIEALPRRLVRGLVLPCDGDSYYVVFPGRDYYRRRLGNPDAQRGKYRSPVGVRRPAFILEGEHTARIGLFVEGEINALSIKAACPAAWVFCPGGAGDFSRASTLYADAVSLRDRIVTVCDRDAAGARAGLALNGELWPRKLEIQLWGEDANELYQKGQLRPHLERRLGLSGETAVQELGKPNLSSPFT